jgi:hypothetical protein
MDAASFALDARTIDFARALKHNTWALLAHG